MLKHYGQGDRLYTQAQQIWLILAAHAVLKPDTSDWGEGYITYGDLAELMGKSRQSGRTLARQLGTVGFYCLEHELPPLNAIVVNQSTGLPGENVLLSDGSTLEKDQDSALNFNWFMIRPPSISMLRDVYERRLLGEE